MCQIAGLSKIVSCGNEEQDYLLSTFVFCEPLKVVTHFSCLLFEGTGHKKGHRFHDESTQFKVTINDPLRLTFAHFFEGVFDRVQHLRHFVPTGKISWKIFLVEMLNHFKLALSHFILQSGFGSGFARGSADVFKTLQPLLPLVKIVRIVKQFDDSISGEIDERFSYVMRDTLVSILKYYAVLKDLSAFTKTSNSRVVV